MTLEIREVSTAAELREFVRFPHRLYRGHPCWVPPLLRDDLETFDPRRNPAYDDAESRQFLARRDGRTVGRVAAILSRVANRTHGTANLRFGWFDAEDDPEAARALLGAAERWAREAGMTSVTGPHGFCDFDPNGMLVEGFDEVGTPSGNYNHPYYAGLLEGAGYAKEVDYVEFAAKPPAAGVPEKLLRLAERVRERGSLRIAPLRTTKEALARAPELFRLLDEAYAEIYGAVPLTRRQMDWYIRKYIPYVDPRLLKLVENAKGEMVGFMVAMPSLVRGLQRARGRLLPLGWLRIMQALKGRENLEFLLAGVRKDVRGLGVDLLMIVDMVRTAAELGFRSAESNQELETNARIQAGWRYFDARMHKRRRVFRKALA